MMDGPRAPAGTTSMRLAIFEEAKRTRTGRAAPAAASGVRGLRALALSLLSWWLMSEPHRDAAPAENAATSRCELDRIFVLLDGRPIGYREYGAAEGLPVVALHGTPGSRLKYARAEAAAGTMGLRLICPDRWGYGDDRAGAAGARAFCGGHGAVRGRPGAADVERHRHLRRRSVRGGAGGAAWRPRQGAGARVAGRADRRDAGGLAARSAPCLVLPGAAAAAGGDRAGLLRLRRLLAREDGARCGWR